MSNDVLITPASRKIEFKDSSANVDAKIETDASGNLLITNTGGDISIGDTTSDIFVGDGTNNIDIVFEQDGEIRGTSGVTVTLGASDSSIRMATDLNLNSNDITNVGDLTVTGNLTITGDINSYNVTDLDVSDKTITVGAGQTEANSGGSGLIVDGSSASLLWDEGDNRFEFNKNIYAPVIYGSGAGITSLNGSNISSGTVAAARIASLAASKITSGTFADARIPSLAASKITSGTFATARIPSLDTSKITSGLLGGARIATGSSGDWWSGNAVKVGTDGVSEVGKYIDFHNTDAGTSDFDTRLISSGSNELTINGVGRILTTADEGTGNGIDADTVDGVEASRIIFGSNSSGTNEATVTNWNSPTKTGFYSDDAASNKWSTANWSSIMHFKLYDDNNNYASQLGFDTYQPDLYYRMNNAGTWTDWYEIYHEGHKPTYSELGTMAYSNLTGTPTIPTNNNQLTNGASYITASSSAVTNKLPLAGGTMTGTLNAGGGINGLTLSNGISGSNFNITGVNVLTMNDPGEGIVFGGGSTTMSLAIVDDATDRILRYSGTGAVFDVQGNITLTGTVDGVDIAARDGVLTSTTTTANAALPKAGGTVTGGITSTAAGNAITISSASPQIRLNDTTSGADDFWIHVNSNIFYVLADRADDGTWETPHPLLLNASNNIGYTFGQRIFTEAYHPNADTLTTARTIAGTSFNGSANIDISYNNLTNQPTIPSISGLAPTASPTFTGDLTIPSKILHNGDINTYIEFHAADQFRVVTGGTERLEVNNSAVTVGGALNVGTLKVDGKTVLDLPSNNPERGPWNPIVSSIRNSGRRLYHDEEFASGTNSIGVYNNAGGSVVTITREAATTNSGGAAPNRSNQVLRVNHNGGTSSPGFGGFIHTIPSEDNHTFVQIFQAKLRTGSNFVIAENAQGTGNTSYWLTETAGTGKWEWYARISHCGNTGTFSSGGHVYVSGGSGNFNWYLASSTVYDVTEVDTSLILEGSLAQSVTGVKTFEDRIVIGDGTDASSRLEIRPADDGAADDIQFYNGSTRVGEIGTQDTTWLRINQTTNKNIYTPRYIRADAGFFVDDTTKGINGSGNFIGGTITGASDANVSNWDTAYSLANTALPVTGVSTNADLRIVFSNAGALQTDASGNLSYNPSTNLLNVDGDINVGSSSDASRFISIDKATTGENGIIFKNGGGDKCKIVQDSSEFLQFHTNNAQAMEINEAGDVNITKDNAVLKFGIPGNGANVNGCWASLEGNTDASGEGSGRLFFREHNSSTGSMDAYGMSLGYRGGATAVTTAGGNSWTGLANIGNGEWGMWGHDGNATGALIMHGPRSGEYVDFGGDLYIPNRIRHTGDINTYMQFHAADQWRVVTGGTERFESNNTRTTVSNGFLQVTGSTSHLVATTTATAATTKLGLTATHKSAVVLDTSSTGTTGTRRIYAIENNAGANLRIGNPDYPNAFNVSSTGNISSTGDVIAYSSSDRRFKDNITPISNPIEKINKLSGNTFEWNGNQETYEKGMKDVGVIAQEVEEVLPEIVDTREDGYKAVKYEKMVALLIEGIKEQQETINKLTSRINNLEKGE